jgi:hypothetical protein
LISSSTKTFLNNLQTIPKGAISSHKRELILHRPFWVTTSNEQQVEVDIETEDGQRFKWTLTKVNQSGRQWFAGLNIDQELLDRISGLRLLNMNP